VVIGGGLTGLWTAIHLKELAPATSVVLLEQERCAHGASGRNAGMLSETIDHSHALAINHFGEDEARVLARLGERNVEEMIRWLGARKINCDLELTGRLMVALTLQQLEDCRQSVKTAGRVGVTTHRLLDRDEVRAELSSPLYLGGVYVSSGGNLNPVKLVEGLKREAVRSGVRLYEQSKVLSVTPAANGSLRVRTGGGTISADRVVLATNAYSHHLFPELLHRFIPLYDYVLVSDPLTGSQRESMRWTGRQGVTDGRTFFNYYRLTSDDRVLWGTSEAAYFKGNEVSLRRDHSPSHYESLKASFSRHFPEVGSLGFPYCWGGPIAATTRMTPFFGTLMNGRVHYGLGYTGHGLGTTRLAGNILAHLALARDNELTRLPLVTRKPLPYPPEPLRRFAVSIVTGGLRRVDQGARPSLFLRLLERLGIGFSS
jgi:glycine/D-amino acid oxidase-like deaminating enzyme